MAVLASVKDVKLSVKDTEKNTGYSFTFSNILNDADPSKILDLGKAFNSIQKSAADKYVKTVVSSLIKVG